MSASSSTAVSTPVLYASKAKIAVISGTIPHGRVGWLFEDPNTGAAFAAPKELYWFAVTQPQKFPASWVSHEEFCRMRDECAKERSRRFLPGKRQSRPSSTLLRGEGIADRHYAL